MNGQGKRIELDEQRERERERERRVMETDHQNEQRLFSLVLFFSVTSALSIVKIHIIVICLMMKY